MEKNWDAVTVSDLKEQHPGTSNEVIERFLDDVRQEAKRSSINLSHLGLNMKYPQELLSDFNFGALLSCNEFYETGYADAMQSGYIEDLKDEGYLGLAAKAEKDLAVIDKMPDFYKEAVKNYIDAFKIENPAFKNVEIPFFHPPMPDYFPDVIHNGKAIEAECLEHQTVQATQVCLMKDSTDAKSPYFVASYQIDKIDDTASYKIQNLPTRSEKQARSMLKDIAEGRTPKKPTLADKLAEAAKKVKPSTTPERTINTRGSL